MNKLKTNRSRRIIAIFFILNFLSTIVPVNLLYANNNGPKAPEAGSFEPVDATDMVNLLTGDFSYVLPLLNVPSPEGGYPISLSYHAGIAMDQEASWTGLGWNLNPGAINRSVNGSPDDYDRIKDYEHLYDQGGKEELFTAGFSYSDPTGTGSVGLDFSWGTNKSFGGSVSLGLGVVSGTIGESNSIGVNIPFSTKNGGALTLGASLSEGGSLNGAIDYSSNTEGFSVSANTNGGIGVGINSALGNNRSLGVDFSFSQNGIGISGTVNKKSGGRVVGGGGAGFNISFASTIEQGNYLFKQSSWRIPISIPTPIGTFGAHFGKQKIKWSMNKTNTNYLYGPLHFNKNIQNRYKVSSYRKDFNAPCNNGIGKILHSIDYVDTLEEAEQIKNNKEYTTVDGWRICNCEIETEIESLMDIYEFPLDQKVFTNLDENNAIFPNLDSFNVDAQGISGNMSIKHFENGNLFGLEKSLPMHDISFSINGEFYNDLDPKFTFESKPEFYFDNEFTSYLETTPATFNTSGIIYNSALDYNQYSNPNGPAQRRVVSKHIEYFTNDEVHNENYQEKYIKGYLKPRSFENIINPDPNGIGAFTITSNDGKKFHYSIPVYNQVTVTRSIGAIKDNNGNAKPQEEAYFERIQDTPYATHWLLTAVTGPDYIDINNNHIPDEDDYGYWVEFDYGKWSDAYAWKAPYGKTYIDSKDDDDFKTKINGFKEVYYLDAVKTRTHTALFSKSLRYDNFSHNWEYKSVDWTQSEQNSNDFIEVFTIPSQPSLKLDKIILLKNEDANNISKTNGDIPSISTGSENIYFRKEGSTPTVYYFNKEDSVLDYSDIDSNTLQKSIKIIDLSYEIPQTSLVRGTPNVSIPHTGRLTLKSVDFKGKSDASILPPYNFKYYNEQAFNLDNKNSWGYYKNEPWMWSLKEIVTPEGGAIQIVYESDDFNKPVIQNNRLFSRGLKFSFGNSTNRPPQYDLPPSAINDHYMNLVVRLDEEDPIVSEENIDLRDYFDPSKPLYIDLWFMSFVNYERGGAQGGHNYSRNHIDIIGQEVEDYTVFDDHIILRNVKAKAPFSVGNDIGIHKASNYSANNYTSIDFGTNKKTPRYDLYWEEEANTYDKHSFSLQYKIIANEDVTDQKDGDLRVKKLITTNGVESYTTNYLYNQLGHMSDPSDVNYKSSGTVSYIPDEDNNPIPYSTELPAPKVMYEYVTIQNENSQQATQYHFNVMKEKDPNSLKFGDFLEIQKTEHEQENNNNRKVQFAEIMIHDNLAAIGQVLDISSFNKEGHLLSKSENEYFSMNDRLNRQGIDQQSYQTYKSIKYKDNLERKDKWLINSSSRRNYAQALKSSKITSGGYSTVTKFSKYDPFSGATLETKSMTNEGLHIKNVVIPAYHKYPQMGSKANTPSNKNMLSQEAARYVLKNYTQPLSVNITTWNDDWTYKNPDGTTTTPTDTNHKIWRRHKSFIWDGELNEDGTYVNYNYSSNNDDGFDWTNPFAVQPSQWKQVSETTLYDHYSRPIEVKDINNNYASTKMWDNNTKVASSSNSKYNEHFTSDAETIEGNYIGNGVLFTYITGIVRSEEKSHTGKYSLKLNANQNAFSTVLKPGEHRSGKYKVSVWVNKENYESVRIRHNNGSIDTFNGETIMAGNWVQLNHVINLSKNKLERITIRSTNDNTFLDDYRLYPISSSVKTYVYNDYDELEAILGSNNIATKYQYDTAGRLIRIYQEIPDNKTIIGGFKRVSEYRYNYARDIN
ncbi:hypothetical protein [Tenacibaculum amylolyticum]|uniref:hypothetical protein n=1 Tax=Tenacibaculum amylolyticum TaxID=104269 RepID=UPI003893F144